MKAKVRLIKSVYVLDLEHGKKKSDGGRERGKGNRVEEKERMKMKEKMEEGRHWRGGGKEGNGGREEVKLTR